MKKNIFLPVSILFVLLCSINLSGCKSPEKPADLIVVDFSQEYPLLDWKLSDIADVSYIPLQGGDSAKLLSYAASFANQIHIDDERIFIGDFSPYRKDGEWHRFSPQEGKLELFDTEGKHLKTVFKSKEENEEILFGLDCSYEIDVEKKEIYAFSAYGKFIRTFNYNGEILANSSTIVEEKFKDTKLFGDTLVLLNLYSQLINYYGELRNNGATTKLYNTRTGQFIPHKGFQFAKPYGLNDIYMSSSVTHTANGIYILTSRTDTVYYLNRKLEMTPKFLSVQQGEDAVNLVCPLVETEDYILFCNSQDSKANREKRFKNANYIYMKGEKQIYQLPCSNHFPEDKEEILWKDEFLLSCYNLTKTPNTLAAVLPIPFLKENYNLLPSDLKQIAASACEEDNPVLMVMRFGKK